MSIFDDHSRYYAVKNDDGSHAIRFSFDGLTPEEIKQGFIDRFGFWLESKSDDESQSGKA